MAGVGVDYGRVDGVGISDLDIRVFVGHGLIGLDACVIVVGGVATLLYQHYISIFQ